MARLHTIANLDLLPDRPTFARLVGRYFGWKRLPAAVPALTLVLMVLMWAVPNPSLRAVAKWLITALGAYVLLVVALSVWRWIAYYREAERRLIRLRNALLSMAGLRGPGPDADFTYRIGGIAEESGSVVIVVDTGSSAALSVGTVLSVVASSTHDSWGTVEIAEITDARARARVVDRICPEFWERLEDRMGMDPSPPGGFHLEPVLPRELADLIALLHE